jgi:hypothetical protein
MNDDLNPAQVYRQNAEELRSLARAMRDHEIKRELFAHALDYERWAKERERSSRSRPRRTASFLSLTFKASYRPQVCDRGPPSRRASERHFFSLRQRR